MKILSDILMIAAVIGGPIILAIVLFNGGRKTRQVDAQPQTRAQADDRSREIYRESESERQDQEARVARSHKPIDVLQRKTGTSG
jgi:hypothetical protein